MVDFFETAIKYFKKLPTWDWLTDQGVIPSNSTTYTYSKLRDVLFEQHGGIPFIGCSGPRFNATGAGRNTADNGYTVLSEVWYYQHVR